jgi:hypothetical protein
VKSNTGGLKLKKQQLDLVRCGDGHRCRQQYLTIADRRIDYRPLDTPKIETRPVAPHLCVVGGRP